MTPGLRLGSCDLGNFPRKTGLVERSTCRARCLCPLYFVGGRTLMMRPTRMVSLPARKQESNALLEMQVPVPACQGVGNHTAIRSSPASEINCRLSHATTARTVSRQSNARSVSVVYDLLGNTGSIPSMAGQSDNHRTRTLVDSPLFIGFTCLVTGRAIPNKPSCAC